MAGAPEGVQAVQIDLDGFSGRLCPLPVGEARYARVLGLAGRIVFLSFPTEGGLNQNAAQPPRPKGRIQAYDLGRQRVETVMDGVSSMSASMDGKTLVVRAGRKVRVLPASFKEEGPSTVEETTRETGWVAMSRYRLEIEPGSEWAQMLREAWRLQRDQFWTEDMSGVNWQRVYERYAALVDRVATRSEFSDLMWEMQGELGTSHAYEMGGDYRPSPRWHRGFLGIDAHWDRRAEAWRIDRIVEGDPWDAMAASPLGAAGLDVRAGDRLLAIDGTELDGSTTPGHALADRAGRVIAVRVARGRRRPRTVIAKALRSDAALRYRDWVEANRRAVHDATDGAVGYVHIPNMGVQGFAEFHRYYPIEVQRDGLIIDVRFNGGGNVSQILLERLLRRRVGYSLSRHSGLRPYPFDSPAGPMVALTNEWAGSDGDIFSHAFKLYGLGPLIGTRTWGGVVGIWPRHSLVDGTVTTQPEFSTWFEDVGWGVEGYGTDPDIEVEITPQDYRDGRDPQMERAIAEITGMIQSNGSPAPVLGPGPVRTPPRLS
jgi:tricorn protease